MEAISEKNWCRANSARICSSRTLLEKYKSFEALDHSLYCFSIFITETSEFSHDMCIGIASVFVTTIGLWQLTDVMRDITCLQTKHCTVFSI